MEQDKVVGEQEGLAELGNCGLIKLLDKEEIRTDGLGSMNMLIDILHECLLQSKNVEIQ